MLTSDKRPTWTVHGHVLKSFFFYLFYFSLLLIAIFHRNGEGFYTFLYNVVLGPWVPKNMYVLGP